MRTKSLFAGLLGAISMMTSAVSLSAPRPLVQRRTGGGTGRRRLHYRDRNRGVRASVFGHDAERLAQAQDKRDRRAAHVNRCVAAGGYR